MLDIKICAKCWELRRIKIDPWLCRVLYVRNEDIIDEAKARVDRNSNPPKNCKYIFEQAVSASVNIDKKEEEHDDHES